jgi:hypothetical protein
MASALQLIATNTIINGQGLYANVGLLSEISTFQNQAPITFLANVYTNALTANANIIANLFQALNTISTSSTNAGFLIDLYPSNVTPTASTGIAYYGNASIQTERIASFSGTVRGQAVAPFGTPGVPGMQRFANVYSTVYSYTVSTFDTVASVNLLQGKTYAQMGLGYTGPVDLVTNGINTSGTLIAAVVAGWGTMYDITNISKCGDVYVFGQNILNQGLGNYGSLTTQLTNAGLNVYNLSQVSPSKTVVTQAATTFAATTPIGAVQLPTIGNVVTTTAAVGNSPDVVSAIYASVTGTDLEAMVLATNVTTTGSTLTTLADYLDFKKVVGSTYYSQLTALGITDFATFGQYLNNKVGKGIFTSWADVAKFLSTIEVPSVAYTTATADTVVLPDGIANNLLNVYGTGTGPFNTMIFSDFLGATSGTPYIDWFKTLNQNYTTLSNSIGLSGLMSGLDRAVLDFINGFSYGTDDMPGNDPDIGPVVANVTALITALNSVTSTSSQTAWYKIANKISLEVANLSKAGVTFNASYPQILKSFAGRISSVGASQNGNMAEAFFANLITNDAAGDTIRLVFAENNNTSTFNYKGISVNNDPNPRLLINQADAQNIPLSTYIKQNK